MRLGTKLAIIGFVLLLLTGSLDPATTPMHTTGSIIGGILFVSGIGAAIGSYDAEARIRRTAE